MNVPPIAPECGSSMIAARPITPESGRPPAIDFATIIEIRLDVEVLHREHPPGAPEPGLHLVRDEDDPVLVADPAQTLDELRRRRQEPALALLRLEHDRGDVIAPRRESRTSARARRARSSRRAAIRVRVRRPVDLGRERPEARLVRMRLRRHRQRHQRAAVERAVERDDALAPRVQARELDRVLDRLGAGVEERGARLAADRDERAEPLGELHVALVRHHGEIGVEEAIGLLGDRLDDARVVVPDVRHADAADEVDERVAVDVRDRRARARDRRRSARGRSAGARPRVARARGSPGCAGPESPSGSRSRGSPPRAAAYPRRGEASSATWMSTISPPIRSRSSVRGSTRQRRAAADAR